MKRGVVCLRCPVRDSGLTHGSGRVMRRTSKKSAVAQLGVELPVINKLVDSLKPEPITPVSFWSSPEGLRLLNLPITYVTKPQTKPTLKWAHQSEQAEMAVCQ